MAQHDPPVVPIVFRGVHLAANPVRRPSMSACMASNVRLMPGGWVRNRGGRIKKVNTVGGTVKQIQAFRDPNFSGSGTHLCQINYASGSTSKWTWFDIATYIIDPFGIVDISQAYDSAWTFTNPAASTNLTDRPCMYNGLGVRNGTDSKPPFSTYYAGVVRYFGLDAYCPAGTYPTVAFAAGAAYNEVFTSVNFYVGLYHEPTGHYSNGVPAGRITTSGALGTITVSNLQRLIPVYNNVTERGELKYVFYATVDGREVPYLIMNAAGTGPLTAAYNATSQSLSVIDNNSLDGNGWNLNLSSEMPTDNFPPRPMKCICVLNQRIYGLPVQGGSGTGSDFAYPWPTRDLASVVWSKANGDDRETKPLGDPQQSWPLVNTKAVTNSEIPKWCAPSVTGQGVLVWTGTSIFLMTELSSGLHDFSDISRIHGLSHPMTIKNTPYGICWVDQRNQVCLLSGDGAGDLTVISDNYQGLLFGKVIQCADYVLDPINQIDRYQMFFVGGYSVCHDFRLRDADFPDGMAYDGTNQDFTAACTLAQQDGTRHYVVAKGGFYLQEAQPATGLIPTYDETFTDTTTQAIATTQINGEYRFNWDCFGDWKERKRLAEVAVIGDGAASAALAASPIAMKWWGDFQDVGAAVNTVLPATENQTTTDWNFRFAPLEANRFLFKIGFTIAGHTSDDTDFLTHRRPSQEGDLDKNFYGSIMEASILLGNRGNR